jgi:hypothetical protein
MANPARPAPTTFEGRLLRRITELEARVAAVERGPRFEVGTAAPVNAVVDDMAGDLRAHFTAVNERLDAMEKKREAAREADIAWKRDLRKTLINTAGIVLVAFIGLGGTITAALIVTGG